MPDLIYPKDYFQAHDESEDTALCFVLMPFAEEYRQVYDGALKPTVEAAGLRCLRADDIYSPRPILVSVMEHIAKAGLIVADLTGRNPNVFYELGVAHMFKTNEQVILIAQKTEDVPFDLRHLRRITYKSGSEGLEALSRDLTNTLVSLGLASRDDLESLIDPSSNETEALPAEPEPVVPPTRGQDWEDVDIVFLEPDEPFDRFKGRFAASLVAWYDYSDFNFGGSEMEFPDGVVTHQRVYQEGERLTLYVERAAKDRLNDLIRAVNLPYARLSYAIPLPFDPGQWVRYLKTTPLKITFISERRVTISPDTKRGIAFVDIEPDGDDRMTVTLRAREGAAFSPSSGAVPFEAIHLMLEGVEAPESFAESLRGYV